MITSHPPPFLLGLDNHQSRFCLVDLPLLDIPYEWNRTVCGLLSASFSKHSVCRAHIHCPVYQLFILFVADTLLWICHLLFIHSRAHEHLGCFHLLVIVRGTAMTCVYVTEVRFSVLLGIYLGMELMGL